MRRACRTDRFCTVFLCSILLVSTGCRRDDAETISNGEWLYEISRRAGLPENDAPAAFMNITEDCIYYQTVQNAVGWDVISTDIPLDPDEPLNRGFAAYTLMNLAGMSDSAGLQIKDISDSPYREQIEQAVAFGLFHLDFRSCFRPEELMDRQDSLLKLETVLDYINGRNPSVQSSIDIPDTVEEKPAVSDLANGTAYYSGRPQISTGMLIEEDGAYYTVDHIVEDEKGIAVEVHRSEPEEITGSFRIAGTSKVDFTEAEVIESFEGDRIKSSYTEPDHTKLAALYIASPLMHSFEYKGYTIDWGLSSSDIHVSVEKEYSSGRHFHALFRLSNVQPVYDWQYDQGKIEKGYFRIDSLATEKVSFTGTASRNLNSDLNELDPYDLLGTIRSAFKENEGADLVIPICTLRIPLPDQPLLTLTLRLELALKADGKAELALTQNGSIGMEIRNGKMRLIHELNNDSQGQCWASAEATANMFFGLNAGSFVLADIGTLTGIQAKVQPYVHLYKGKNHTVVQENNVGYDILDEHSTPDFLVCADLMAGWIMDLELNSSSSLAGRLGFSYSGTVLEPDLDSILPPGMRHMENGMFMRECTRLDRETPGEKASAPQTDRIRISSYSLIIDPQESIELPVITLPEGYSLNDLTILSLDPDTVSVEGLRITGRKPGSVRIRISTADSRYSVECSVLVRSPAV